MKRKALISVLCVILSVMTVAGAGALTVFADGSHGYYMTCDASVTDWKSDGFMIDFYSDSPEAFYTYWSNANWSMYTIPSIKKLGYAAMTGGGAYAGLQLRSSDTDRTGIMSLWRYEYRNKETKKIDYVYAKAIYGKTTTYDNEGSGTSCVMPYRWENSQWYRELLFCWTDEETGYTFIGTWYYDYTADKWTLFAYYNTFLVESYIKSDIGQFLENYVESFGARYRSFRYRNVYFMSNATKEWISSPFVKLRSDGNPKAFGETKMGVSEDGTYIWASVDGTSPIDSDTEERLEIRLSQDAKPTVGKPSVATLTSINMEIAESEKTKIAWSFSDNSTPQLSYRLVVTDTEGNELINKYETRPEVNNVVVDKLPTDAVKCDLTVTDVFGQTTSTTYTSEEYTAELNADKEAIAEKEQELLTFVETMNGKLSSGKYSEESIAVITEAIADVNAFLADESKRSEADIAAITAVVDSAVAAEQSGLVKGVDGKTIAIVASACALFLVAAVVVVVLVVRKKKKA